MSVNTGFHLKALLILLIVNVTCIDALLIKHKQPKIAVHTHKQTMKHNVPKITKPYKERQLLQKPHNTSHKIKQLTHHNDKHSTRQLKDLLTNFMPVAVIAMIAYMLITAPFFGFLLFGLPLFLNSFSAVLGSGCKNSRKLREAEKVKQTMNIVKSKLTQDMIIKEGRKLLKFLKSENVQFGEPISEDSFLRLLEKYTSNDTRFKHHKSTSKQLKTMVENIYNHKDRLADVLNKAT